MYEVSTGADPLSERLYPLFAGGLLHSRI